MTRAEDVFINMFSVPDRDGFGGCSTYSSLFFFVKRINEHLAVFTIFESSKVLQNSAKIHGDFHKLNT